ncbi:ALDH-like protein [Suillus decipiens]|nr:ALDH-like protein [Suillus decipiens]
MFRIPPAPATSNTIVLKPSKLTSPSALLSCTLIKEAGFPPGIIIHSLVVPRRDGKLWATRGIYVNRGRNRPAGSSVFVQEGIHDKLLDQFAEQAAIKVGDPFLPDTYRGPQASKTQFKGSFIRLYYKHTLTPVERCVTSGTNDGATVHLGGKRIGQEGYFIEPTVFTCCCVL